MAYSVPNWLRWLTLGPLALLATVVVQGVVFVALLSLLQFGLGTESWVRWLAKTLTSPFMGAAFVAVAWWIAPSHRRAAAIGALGLVGLWASALMFGAFHDQFVWLFTMGMCGLLGGAASYLLGRNVYRISGVA